MSNFKSIIYCCESVCECEV